LLPSRYGGGSYDQRIGRVGVYHLTGDGRVLQTQSALLAIDQNPEHGSGPGRGHYWGDAPYLEHRASPGTWLRSFADGAALRSVVSCQPHTPDPLDGLRSVIANALTVVHRRERFDRGPRLWVMLTTIWCIHRSHPAAEVWTLTQRRGALGGNSSRDFKGHG